MDSTSNSNTKQLKTELMEAILTYFEGRNQLTDVLAIGINAQRKNRVYENATITKIISQLNEMNNTVTKGNQYSIAEIKDTFTDMLDQLNRSF